MENWMRPNGICGITITDTWYKVNKFTRKTQFFIQPKEKKGLRWELNGDNIWARSGVDTSLF